MFRKEIQDRIAGKTDVTNDIFDTAQIEVSFFPRMPMTLVLGVVLL